MEKYMWKKLTPLVFASLVGGGTPFMPPSAASAMALPAAQRDALNVTIGATDRGLYQQADHKRRWYRHRHRDNWRWGRRDRWDGWYGGYYPYYRRHHRHFYYDYPYDYPYGYGYGWGPGIYFSF
jgi:hypothetical protein